ncbi:hypothetical protein [Pseudalkalibacillus sp. NRS-1564]|uniref:hypothetical protein n=1 Tax=Pseudalkalibacillus sp. NRS-1564 TaxID=3233900 RepID=UPI003D2DCB82
MDNNKKFNPHIVKRQLREKLATNSSFSQEDVDNARLLAKMDGSNDSRTVFAAAKKRLEVKEAEVTKEPESKPDEILDQINELLSKLNQE